MILTGILNLFRKKMRGRGNNIYHSYSGFLKVLLSVIFLMFLLPAAGQEPVADIAVWEPDIRKFEQLDSVQRYSPSSVLFVGSSSIRLWATLADDMVPYEVIQRGYGGAKLDDLLYYAERIIYPHQFRAVVLFIANDITGNEKDKTPDEVQHLAGEVISVIRAKYPEEPVFYISTTPTSQRWEVWPLIKEANDKIEQLCKSHPNLYFINTETAFLYNGLPADSLFLGDRLHLNGEGYRLWRDLIKNELDRVLGPVSE